MDKLIVEGPNKLNGEVEISGSKNSSLAIIAASILADGNITITNVPDLKDIETMTKVLIALGAKIDKCPWVPSPSGSSDNNEIRINASGINKFEAPYQFIKTMRAGIYVLGPLLSKFGKAIVSIPGGCVIGARPINLHLRGFESMGAKISIEHGYIKAVADRLKGADITLDVVSVGATANIMMAATLADGETFIRNAAKEPHIVDLGNFLKKLGAKINGFGTDCIRIKGVRKLKGYSYRVVSDYIEAGTYMLAASITGGQIILKSAPINNLDIITDKLESSGTSVKKISDNKIKVTAGKAIKPVDIITLPYPGFPTDMQAQWMSLMAIAKGISVITETIWENRFMHVAELNRMGADIKIDGNKAFVKGVKKLSGAQVMVSDLRAGAALVLASLVARGKTEISRVYHLDRGYENLEEKLTKLGARIKRIK